MPISTIWILKYVQQCYVKWFSTISLGAPASCLEKSLNSVKDLEKYLISLLGLEKSLKFTTLSML